MELGDRYLVVQRAAIGANPAKLANMGIDIQMQLQMGMTLAPPAPLLSTRWNPQRSYKC